MLGSRARSKVKRYIHFDQPELQQGSPGPPSYLSPGRKRCCQWSELTPIVRHTWSTRTERAFPRGGLLNEREHEVSGNANVCEETRALHQRVSFPASYLIWESCVLWNPVSWCCWCCCDFLLSAELEGDPRSGAPQTAATTTTCRPAKHKTWCSTAVLRTDTFRQSERKMELITDSSFSFCIVFLSFPGKHLFFSFANFGPLVIARLWKPIPNMVIARLSKLIPNKNLPLTHLFVSVGDVVLSYRVLMLHRRPHLCAALGSPR